MQWPWMRSQQSAARPPRQNRRQNKNRPVHSRKDFLKCAGVFLFFFLFGFHACLNGGDRLLQLRIIGFGDAADVALLVELFGQRGVPDLILGVPSGVRCAVQGGVVLLCQLDAAALVLRELQLQDDALAGAFVGCGLEIAQVVGDECRVFVAVFIRRGAGLDGAGLVGVRA